MRKCSIFGMIKKTKTSQFGNLLCGSINTASFTLKQKQLSKFNKISNNYLPDRMDATTISTLAFIDCQKTKNSKFGNKPGNITPAYEDYVCSPLFEYTEDLDSAE